MAVPEVKDPEFVVAIDFGTSLSKAAYAVSPHRQKRGFLELDNVAHLITDWPDQESGVGVKCCKTKTCVWYMPGPEPESFELKDWGWKAYVNHRKHAQNLAQNHKKDARSGVLAARSTPGGDSTQNSSRQQDLESLWVKKQGYLLDGFKLWLVHKKLENLPVGLCLNKVISDFLKGMSIHILQELQQKTGKTVSKRHIRWCITVPAMWNDCQRQSMEDCAEMAGLVQGPLCKDESASLYDLITVVEPEAASIYSHNTLQTLCSGDTFVVVDLGGGTMDLVTHKKIGTTTRSNVRVQEVSRSIGGLHGGDHVDDRFLEHLRKVVGTPSWECFEEFEKQHPALLLDILRDWGRIKASFDGETEEARSRFVIRLPSTLAVCWQKHYNANLKRTRGRRRKYFTEIDLGDTEVRQIFDKEIDPILGLMQKRIVPSVDYIIVVGGFSESPYVRKRIQDKFSSPPENKMAATVIFPRNPDTAVVRGAVALGILGEWESFVSSRIANRTYGFDTSELFDPTIHEPDHRVYSETNGKAEELCDNIFHVLIQRGDGVAFNTEVQADTSPLYRLGYPDDENIEISLFSTLKKNPRYVDEEGVTKEATCIIPVPWRNGMPRSKQTRLGVSAFFGGTRIRVLVWNLRSSGERIAMPPVRLEYTAESQMHREHLDMDQIDKICRRQHGVLNRRLKRKSVHLEETYEMQTGMGVGKTAH